MRLFLMITVFAMSLAACGGPAGEAAKTGEAGEKATASATAKNLKVNTSASIINWEGSKPTESHFGTLSLSGGKLSVKGGDIEAGEFTIDMASLKVTDEGMDDKTKAKLTGHLSNEDFFDVPKFPTAKFVITKVTPYKGEDATHNISGNLTLKDQTKEVTFKANVTPSNEGLTAESETFKIDRTKWGANYGSPSVFNLKDKFINDEVGLKIKLVAE